MRPDRRKSDSSQQKYIFEDYRQLLKREKQRSERHKHFFALFGLRFKDPVDEEFTQLVRTQLRESDYLFWMDEVEDDLRDRTRLGVLLPETDPVGAEIVKERLVHWFHARMTPVQIRSAIYPDNGTFPDQLLGELF